MPTTCTLNPGDVWCGTVTVGKVAEAKGKTIGYGFHETWHGAGVGGLPDGRIVYGLNSYRIDEAMVGVGATDKSDGFLYFSLNRAFPDADRARLVLHVGSDRFPLSEAHFESSTHTYHWRKTGLDWSSTSSVTLRLQANLPSAPTAVTATAPARTGGLLEVRWSAPAPAQSITGYEVKYWRAADPQDENPRRFRTKQTESTETKMLLYPFLDASTEYKLQVRARNAIGAGAWSEVATARTGAKQSSKPILRLAVIDANGADINQITAGETFRYRVKVRDLLNHHQSSGKDFTGWGTLGVRGPISIEYFNGDVRYGCHGAMHFWRTTRGNRPPRGTGISIRSRSRRTQTPPCGSRWGSRARVVTAKLQRSPSSRGHRRASRSAARTGPACRSRTATGWSCTRARPTRPVRWR